MDLILVYDSWIFVRTADLKCSCKWIHASNFWASESKKKKNRTDEGYILPSQTSHYCGCPDPQTVMEIWNT